jgi:hypothetical protein
LCFDGELYFICSKTSNLSVLPFSSIGRPGQVLVVGGERERKGERVCKNYFLVETIPSRSNLVRRFGENIENMTQTFKLEYLRHLDTYSNVFVIKMIVSLACIHFFILFSKKIFHSFSFFCQMAAKFFL